jgi:hypothetical protein
MKIRSNLPLFIIVALMALVPLAYPCSWATGYFHQVTCLRGRVVGVNKSDLRHRSRWLRQRVVRGDVLLTLYEYRQPVKDQSQLRAVKQVGTNKDGNFDFGRLPDGHYTVVIDAPWGDSDRFDVQIVQLPKRTGSVTLDISPVYPDCQGGHEWIVVPE